MHESNKQNYLRGAAVLAAASILVKIVSGIYKMPIQNVLGEIGSGHFQITYNIYMFILAISTQGIPVALSRLIAAAEATGRPRLTKRYFSVAMPAFIVIGVIFSAAMAIFADELAGFFEDSLSAPGIQVMAPAILFVCIISVYRGYAQGHGNMTPTAISQVIEVVVKTIFGLTTAWLLLRAGRESHIISAGATVGVSAGLGLAIPLLAVYKRKTGRLSEADLGEDDALPSRANTLKQILKVSIPISLGSAFMSVMTLLDGKVVMSQLKSGLGLPELEAVRLYGIYGRGLSIYNVPTALIVPISISIIPAIAAALAGMKRRESAGIMESAIKFANLIAMPAGIGISVLAAPIYGVIYGDFTGVLGPQILMILGVASFFVCLQIMTTALLQATGNERVPMITYVIGGLSQIALDYFLVPKIGIIGSPIGTVTCYGVISILNLIFVLVKVKERPKLTKSFLKPLICAAVMGVAARAVYELIFKLMSGTLGVGRLVMVLYLGAAIVVAVLVYAVLIIATGTLTKEDMRLLPKGEKIAKIMRIK